MKKYLFILLLAMPSLLIGQTTSITLPKDRKSSEFNFTSEKTIAEAKKYFADNHITQEEFTALKIKLVKDTKLKKKTYQDIVKKETFYTSTKGKIETILTFSFFKSEYGDYFIINEYLISYNASGQYLDMLKVSGFGGNDYSIYEATPTYKIKNNVIALWFDEGGESWGEGYRVTSLLKFQAIKNYKW